MKGYQASAKQIGYIKGLAKKRGIEITDQELEGIKYQEAHQMIQTLLSDKEFEELKKRQGMRMKLISMARTVGWEKEGQVDLVRLEKWCIKYGHAHKKLNQYNSKELPKLLSQFQFGVLRDNLKKKLDA